MNTFQSGLLAFVSAATMCVHPTFGHAAEPLDNQTFAGAAAYVAAARLCPTLKSKSGTVEKLIGILVSDQREPSKLVGGIDSLARVMQQQYPTRTTEEQEKFCFVMGASIRSMEDQLGNE